MIYFISDQHWGHAKIIHMEHRPFNNVFEMNEYMIDAWNSVVTDDDEVYLLGDVSYKMNLNILKNNILPRLKGRIHLIRGNHDRDKVIYKIGDRFETIEYYKVLTYVYNNVEYHFVLFHFPIKSWDGMYRNFIHLHGHDHKLTEKDFSNERFFSMNVTVEHLNYVPISAVDVINKFIDRRLKNN